jgi:hypothetical protein
MTENRRRFVVGTFVVVNGSFPMVWILPCKRCRNGPTKQRSCPLSWEGRENKMADKKRRPWRPLLTHVLFWKLTFFFLLFFFDRDLN